MSTQCCHQGLSCLHERECSGYSPDGRLFEQVLLKFRPLLRRMSGRDSGLSKLSPLAPSDDDAFDKSLDDARQQLPMRPEKEPPAAHPLPVIRPRLFNRLTIMLLTGWIGIVAFSLEMTKKEVPQAALPGVEVFLRSLL